MRRTVRAYALGSDKYHTYELPTEAEAVAHLKATHGKQYDSVERKTVEGGIPLLWKRIPEKD